MQQLERCVRRCRPARRRQRQDVPGVVAMAATETGVVYEGVFGISSPIPLASSLWDTTAERSKLLHTPLMFDPGERSHYGGNIDWVGRGERRKAYGVYFRGR